MNNYFVCKNGQNISWTSVCDGHNQCIDGSDERNCYCQGDVYACLQGNNVSCKIACATYGRVTCLTYQNIRACEQYIREHSSTTHVDINSTGESTVLMNDFDALRYSVCLAMGILLFVSFISILIYLIRKKPSQLLFSCFNQSLNINRKSPNRLSSIIQQQQQSSSINLSHSRYTPAPSIHDLPPSYHYSDQNSISINDCYEPPPYPGLPLFCSDSTYYETIKTPSISNSMPITEPYVFNHIRIHCV